MTFADALLDCAHGLQRVKRAEIWRAFQRAHPVEASAGDARERLVRRLRELASEGRITLPSEKGTAWDRSARPALPEWVAVARPSPPAPTLQMSSIPWAPELAFVATTPGVDLHAALAVQEFLARGGRNRPLVPMRERSVQLFGDEKRLERLLRTSLFSDGRLDLQVLRCFAMAPPLVFEEGPEGTSGRPCLIVENHHTWWSFCRWNARVGEYSAIVYGSGAAFGREAVLFLDERCRTWGTNTAEYFGDLDRDGLEIPWRAAKRYTAGARLRLIPAGRWYTLLLERASIAMLPVGPAIDLAPEVLEWLPEPARSIVKGHFSSGMRVPQELIGTEALAQERASIPPGDVPP